MSSVIGHSLVGWTIFANSNDRDHNAINSRYSFLWLGWFILVAIVPDVDYIIPFIHPSSHEGLRITHSILFCQILPLFTLIYLQLKRKSKKTIKKYIIPLILAGFSHIILDLLVGVTSLPLFFPFSDHIFKLPFGILPSAGKINLFNYYFYRNLAIELGILIPLSCCSFFLKRRQKLSNKRLMIFALLLIISGKFMYWAYSLSR